MLFCRRRQLGRCLSDENIPCNKQSRQELFACHGALVLAGVGELRAACPNATCTRHSDRLGEFHPLWRDYVPRQYSPRWTPLRTYPETGRNVVEWRRKNRSSKEKRRKKRAMTRTKPWQVSDELWER